MVVVPIDRGSFAHFGFGVVAGFTRAEGAFTVIMLAKQFGDVFLKAEDWRETAGDLVEYAWGLVMGLLMRVLGGLDVWMKLVGA